MWARKRQSGVLPFAGRDLPSVGSTISTLLPSLARSSTAPSRHCDRLADHTAFSWSTKQQAFQLERPLRDRLRGTLFHVLEGLNTCRWLIAKFGTCQVNSVQWFFVGGAAVGADCGLSAVEPAWQAGERFAHETYSIVWHSANLRYQVHQIQQPRPGNVWHTRSSCS